MTDFEHQPVDYSWGIFMGAKETSPSLQIIKAGSRLLAYPVFRVGSIYNYVFYIVLYKLTDSTYGNDEKFSILMGIQNL